jgi:hypothetical protein
MKNEPIKNVDIPLKIQDKYGYSLDFLINNKVQDDMFLETQLSRKPLERQRETMNVFDRILDMQDKKYKITESQ